MTRAACPSGRLDAALSAIDWASRTINNKPHPFAGKPGGVFGVGGGTGATRAAVHLRDICVFLDVSLMMKPEVGVTTHTRAQLDGGSRACRTR